MGRFSINAEKERSYRKKKVKSGQNNDLGEGSVPVFNNIDELCVVQKKEEETFLYRGEICLFIENEPLNASEKKL